MAMEVTRQHVINILHKAGFPEEAEEAGRVLPDPVELDDVVRWAAQHGIYHDQLVSWMGGSP